jgi:leader peptidase (prepilin peptidase)/N-methyltransferase
VFLLISVLVIDFEHQLILDEIVFIGFVSAVIIYILSGVEIYSYLLTGFGAATALLLLNIVTRGRGMGLGDVKFAIYGGIFFKPFQGMVWLFLSFIIGALIGLTLILFGKSKFGQKIAFGPFLVISLLISLIFVNSFHLF